MESKGSISSMQQLRMLCCKSELRRNIIPSHPVDDLINFDRDRDSLVASQKVA